MGSMADTTPTPKHLDPHEAPPQKLRDIYKSWTGATAITPERLKNEVLDTESLGLGANAGAGTESISAELLEQHFRQFLASNAFQTDAIEDPGSGNASDLAASTGDLTMAALKAATAYYIEKIPGLMVFPSLLPPSVQQSLLSGLLHRELSNQENQTNLHLHHTITYPPNKASFFTTGPEDSPHLPKDHATHKALSNRAVLEKGLHWVTLGGQYDWTKKEYPTSTPPVFPPAVAHLINSLFPSTTAQAAILNIYTHKDKLSLHRDVSEAVDRGLVSISLGCDALFVMGLKDKTSGELHHETLLLRSGDVLYMDGESRHGQEKACPPTNIPKFLELQLSWSPTTTMDWQTLAETKRDSVNALIPPSWRLPCPVPPATEQRDVTGKYIQQFLSPREVEITETDAVGIVKQTTTGSWTALEVTEAFCHRASLAHQMVNCLHEIFFEAALSDARELDEYFVKNGKPVGPLHGLPISLKDQFHVKGVETTMGYVGWINTFQGRTGTGKERVFESELATTLRRLGAILYVKTSVPHTLMAGETMNNIIKYTWNPTNRFLSSGGSSGGEGALISLKGSPVGFGTDIGGSIRIPAAFNGLYGIRPSSGRLPYEGMANSMDGQNSILSVVGPLATSVGALKLVIDSVLSQEPWLHDPLVAEIPWRDEHEKAVFDIVKAGGGGRLTFGVMKADGAVSLHPPVRRAIDIVIKTAEKLGHTIVDWEPPSHERGLDLVFQTWLFDGGADVHAAFALSGEPMIGPIAAAYGTLKQQYTASQIAAVNVGKRAYQKEYMEYWNSTSALTGTGRPVDAVIAPIAPYAATRPDIEAVLNEDVTARFMMPGFSTIVNLLDYSTSVLPVTKADKRIDVVDVGYTPLNSQDQKVHLAYDPEIYDGAHVAVQIIGRRFQEEKVLALTEILGDALGNHVV
ncbi:Acetamidase [Lachnellula occidentalis]|uniref:amidase n=1 Tax=Lachnellula occidentalis TaxID=215460 RepID=A0A8H8U5D7_9HELO|nr:Acetamidase [Lachnellula occidentalis]